jgi:glyoxylase-like metal-dependent hydrolase (beta-lactamase superfamily II)
LIAGNTVMRIDYLQNSNVIWCRVTHKGYINYCWIVVNPKTQEAVIIDPAWDFIKINQLLSQANAKLTAVLLTHHHHDHVDLAKTCAFFHDTSIYISEPESHFYGYKGERIKTFMPGELLSLAGFSITPVSTPGHTFGSTCYWIDQALFTGDTLFNEGCGLCYGKGADPGVMYQSIQHLIAVISDDTRVYPGHRFLSDLGQRFDQLKRLNIYLNIKSEEQFISFRMRESNRSSAFQFV